MCYLALRVFSGKQLLDIKEETHRQIELDPKDGVDILGYSDLTLSAIHGIDLDLESVVVW